MTTSSAPCRTVSAETYARSTLNHLGLVSAMVDELGLVEQIDSLVVQDHEQRHVSVGLAAKAMILNGLGFVHRALYLMPLRHLLDATPPSHVKPLFSSIFQDL
ncbi:MAG: DUF4277 domain-containing protein [Methylococcaceae bacterium]|nr:DUF4277 domain-containing protein [Methylococcaceae bacterium]